MNPPPRHPSVWVAQSWWVEDIYEGIASVCLKQGWRLLAPGRHTRTDTPVIPENADAAILFPGTSPALRAAAHALTIPVVNLDQYDTATAGPRITWDDRAIGRAAAVHLAASEVVELIFVAHPTVSPIPLHRREGFLAAAARLGIPARVVPAAGFSFRDAARAGRIGLFSGNDATAADLLMDCLHAGYRVPQDFAIVGADDDRIECESLPVPLSSVDTQLRLRGVRAAELLMRRMRGEPTPDSVEVPIGPVTLRDSTRTFDHGDPELNRIVRHFRENAWRDTDVGTLCAECGVTARHVQQRMKAKIKTSPLALLRDSRLALFERLRLNPLITLEAAARDAGFGSLAAYRRAAKR